MHPRFHSNAQQIRYLSRVVFYALVQPEILNCIASASIFETLLLF